MSTPQIVDVMVVGGGIVGLATARSLHAIDPSLDICLLEKEPAVALHQTGRNSGVLHSGLYYRPGSLKARLCIEGRERMVAFCQDEALPIRISGKLVVAATPEEIPRLEELHARGVANGVAGLERLGPDGIADHEPYATGLAALWVPGTGVVDFPAIAHRISERLRAGGVEIVTDSEVDAIARTSYGAEIGAGERRYRTRLLINAAGLHADRVAKMAGDEVPARIVPFRGEYWDVDPGAADLVRNLVYPVPDPRFPFLGVHLTRRVDGTVEMGPNAVLAWGRQHYRGTRPRVSGLMEAFGYRGFRKLARRHLGNGLGELVRSKSRILSARRGRRMLPGLRATDLHRGGSGIRAQAVFADGTLADDFVLSGEGPMLHVLSAPSPAATAALAIGDHLAEEGLRRLREETSSGG